jgi:hypothetical protein
MIDNGIEFSLVPWQVDGTIIVQLKGAPLALTVPEDPFTQWERQYESEKAARRGDRHQATR